MDDQSSGQAEVKTPTRNERDAQRGALRDLVLLSTQCTAAETEIERRYKSEAEEAEKEFTKTNQDIEHRQSALIEKVQQKYEERTAKITAQFESESATVKTADASARQRIEHDQRTLERDVKQKYEQAAWLADSVLEATQIQLREAAKKVKEEVEAHLAALDSMENNATARMQEFGRAWPGELEPEAIDAAISENVQPNFATHLETIERGIRELGALRLPRWFVGATPFIVGALLCAAAAGAAQVSLSTTELKWTPMGIAGGAMLAVVVVGGVMLRKIAKSQVDTACRPVQLAFGAARSAAQKYVKDSARLQEERYLDAMNKRESEIQSAKEKYGPLLTQAARRRDSALQAGEAEYARQMPRLEHQRDHARQEVEEWQRQNLTELQHRMERDLKANEERRSERIAENQRRYDEDLAGLKQRWNDGLERISAPIGPSSEDGQNHADWNDPSWNKWVPPKQFASQVRFGELRVDLKQLTDMTSQHLALPETFSVPAFLAFPRQSSLLIYADRNGRAEAIRVLQMVMTRLLTSLPAGRVRFTIIDPVGLGQNFAGFMHLADHDEALVGGRIWTDSAHIDQRLTDLTEHMETVIQKYLRNEFETIDDYNAQAGELAEPYRFLVIADFPVNFEGDAFRRLSSIASAGSRCGVYTLVARDTRVALPSGTHIDELETHSVNLIQQGDHFVWKDEVFRQFPLKLDAPPAEDFLTRILDVVGLAAKDANRVEVPFDTIAPSAEQFWSGSSMDDLRVPIGRIGATRQQMMRLGRGVAQHVLIAGKTGSGKSTLLHAMITNLAMWYHPDEVELYLIDFKKGVEFKTYAEQALPHARAIAVESDREFGLSVLQRIDAELARRGAIFRKLGVQDLASYRQTAKLPMPRTLLIIDEFQEFFSEDDKLAQDAALLLDRLVRQGRAFGIHVLLGSQTIGGTSGLGRTTIGQMAVRVALQTSEADSQLILGDNNSAARLLSRPGEAIYNDAGGLVEGNSPFQVAWLPDERREKYLRQVRQRADAAGVRTEPAIVFEGNAPADITKNESLSGLLAASSWPTIPAAPLAWLGDPVAIKEPTAATFRRQSGANLLIIGQNEEAAMAIMASSVISLASQQAPTSASFYIFDGSPADSPLAGVFSRVKSALPHDVRLVEWRSVADAINELAEELQKRQASDLPNAPAVYTLVYGLQRYRMLRKQEESFSFSAGEEAKRPNPDKQFSDLLREGPALGIHVLAWCDTSASLDRTLDRGSMREFDHRVLFQMSAADSSNLIDSPAANKLGFYRALAYSEEQGVIEKFRPYGLPDKNWQEEIKSRLADRAAGVST